MNNQSQIELTSTDWKIIFSLLILVVFLLSWKTIQTPALPVKTEHQEVATVAKPAKLSPSETESAAEKAKRRQQQERKNAAINRLFGGKTVEPKSTSKPIRTGTRFKTVEAYFKDGNPNPLSHRLGEPNYDRNVTSKTKQEVKARDGNCCLVCGSTYQLEVDHRIALMNGGDNSIDNLGTLCDSCHNAKTRYDYAIRKRRQKEAAKH